MEPTNNWGTSSMKDFSTIDISMQFNLTHSEMEKCRMMKWKYDVT